MEVCLSNITNIEVKNSIKGLALISEYSLSNDIIGFKTETKVYDLHADVPAGSIVTPLYKSDDEYIHFLRHDAAHVLAQGLTVLFPKVEFGKQFFQDVHVFGFGVYLPEHKFTKDDFSSIENAMKQVIARKDNLIRYVWSKAEAKEKFEGDSFKQDIITNAPGDIMAYEHGDYIDICGGPRGLNNDHIEHFVLLDIKDTAWMYDSNKKMQTIIGACFRSKAEMDKFMNSYSGSI